MLTLFISWERQKEVTKEDIGKRSRLTRTPNPMLYIAARLSRLSQQLAREHEGRDRGTVIIIPRLVHAIYLIQNKSGITGFTKYLNCS